MSEQFLETIQQNLKEKTVQNKWDKKITSFINGVEYLNIESLINEHFDKLLCVGVNSLNDSAELIRTLTSENINIIENNLKTLINDIDKVVQKFDLLEKTLNQKKGFFSTKEPLELFFELFAKEESALHEIIRELNIKKTSLSEIKDSLNEGLNQILETYTILERDIKFLNESEKEFKKYPKDSIKKAYLEREFELVQIKTDLLTQQQILFQKYAAIKILIDNVNNCYRNISFISNVSYSVIMNTLELQKIIQLKKSLISNEDMEVLQKVKNAITLASTDMKIVASQPFCQHNFS